MLCVHGSPRTFARPLTIPAEIHTVFGSTPTYSEIKKSLIAGSRSYDNSAGRNRSRPPRAI